MKLHKHTETEWTQRKTEVFIWENDCGFTVEIRHFSTKVGANWKIFALKEIALIYVNVWTMQIM